MRRLKPWQKKRYLKYKSKKYNDIEFDDERYSRIIDNVFTENDFIRQVEEVKSRLSHIEPELIDEVIKFHIRSLSKEITKVRPWKRIIYIYQWARIDVFPLCYNPYSVYYNLNKTKKLLRKYSQEIKRFLNKQL